VIGGPTGRSGSSLYQVVNQCSQGPSTSGGGPNTSSSEHHARQGAGGGAGSLIGAGGSGFTSGGKLRTFVFLIQAWYSWLWGHVHMPEPVKRQLQLVLSQAKPLQGSCWVDGIQDSYESLNANLRLILLTRVSK
jgi:hypothetical protein